MGVCLLYGFFCNPHNETPDIVVGDSNLKYFNADVAQHVPNVLIIMGFVCLALSWIGATLLTPKVLPTKDEEVELLSNTSTDEESILTELKTPLFWKMFAILHIGFFSCLWINITFKNFGSIHIKDDHQLTFIGSLAATATCLSRGLFPFMIDYVEFFKINICVLFTLAVVSFSIFYAASNPYSLGLCVVVTLVCMGAQFFPFSLLCMKIYGTVKGPKVFSFLGWAATSGGVLSTFYFDLTTVIGFRWGYWLQGINCLVALVISNSLRIQSNSANLN